MNNYHLTIFLYITDVNNKFLKYQLPSLFNFLKDHHKDIYLIMHDDIDLNTYNLVYPINTNINIYKYILPYPSNKLSNKFVFNYIFNIIEEYDIKDNEKMLYLTENMYVLDKPTPGIPDKYNSNKCYYISNPYNNINLQSCFGYIRIFKQFINDVLSDLNTNIINNLKYDIDNIIKNNDNLRICETEYITMSNFITQYNNDMKKYKDIWNDIYTLQII